MQLVINTFGAYIHCSGEMFEIKIEGKKKLVSPKKVQSIVITTGASFSTDAVQLAVENNIDIVFLNKFGDPFGRVWHGRLGSTARIRRAQLAMTGTPQGFETGKSFVLQKFRNQIEFLESMRKKRSRLSKEITETIRTIEKSNNQMEAISGVSEESRGSVMGIEGQAGKIYWAMMSRFLPERFQFSGRSRNPARDEFNCLLNYAYGVMYSTVERACILAGIDPYIGFIHTDHYAKTSFVFDVIEGYRVFAEETVVHLFSAKKVKKSLFKMLKNGMTLNKEGKQVLLTDFNEYLDQSIRYRGRNIKRRDTIQFDLHRLANSWIE